ncbi:MAG: hypothetical protein CVU84_15405 [Firmicutes bacterium HGW-Firmicutes-1]|jgi:uracil-DNA glycosylase family 4|nr:MAG: hypothetical protein CVU84_15405 [Firmicutes bacterium HGW-Firmicutes-1]
MKQAKIAEIYKECSTLITEQTQEIHQLVLGTGNYDAGVLIIGDVPTSEEEDAGIPFVGRAGKPLNDCLEALGIKKEDAYITHLVKYRPYKINEKTGRVVTRAPKKEEIQFFLPYLLDEIGIISPKIIVTLGAMPLRALMDDNRLQMNAEHGKVRTKYINNRVYKILPFSQNVLDRDDDEVHNEDIEVIRKLIDHARVDKEIVKEEVKTTDSVYTISPKKVKPKPIKTEQKSSKLKAIIIYGGDGYADDPTLVAIDRISNVLTELNTSIVRFDLYKDNYDIQEFFVELSEARAVVIATTVEWLGIGGYLQLFLDKCWKYGNKTYFSDVYLFGVVISKQHYERDTYNHLIKSWELLGGVEGGNICANIKKSVELETNVAMLNSIDKKTEEFYRIAHQNRPNLPTSIRNNKIFMEVSSGKENDYTYTETVWDNNNGIARQDYEGQDTFIPNYDAFMEKQQKDIEDIANLFKQKLSTKEIQATKTEPEIFKAAFIGGEEAVSCKIQWIINDRANKNFVMDLRNGRLSVYFGAVTDFNTIIHLDEEVLGKVMDGKMTVQRAFMTGEIKAKGDFTIVYKLDGLFDLAK